MTTPNLDADRMDLGAYFADLDRVRRITFARAQRRERFGMTHAARMKDYYERLDYFLVGLWHIEPRKPRKMRILSDE